MSHSFYPAPPADDFVDETIHCLQCGHSVVPDASPGVWIHDRELGGEAFDLDEDHSALPPEEALEIHG